MKRRDFMKTVMAGTCGGLMHRLMTPASGMMAYAAPVTAAALAPDNVLVIVNLAGGVSQNITPIYNQYFAEAMGALHFTEAQSHVMVPGVQGLHPSLNGLFQIYNEGRLAVFNMVGDENNNRSHAEATQLRMMGLPRGVTMLQSGWGARAACQIASHFASVSLDGSVSLLEGDCNDGRAIDDIENFGERGLFDYWNANSDDRWMRQARENVRAMSEVAPFNTNLKYVKDSMDNLAVTLENVKTATAVDIPDTIDFGNSGFGNSCRDAARLIMARNALGIRVIYLAQGGYDTHQNERQALTGLLSDLDEGLTGLVNAGKQLGFWNNMTIVTMTEFGRTFANNGTPVGTDHGNACAQFVLGGQINGGIKNDPPGAAQIVGHDYLNTVAIPHRNPLKLIVAGMGLDPERIFPGTMVTTDYALFR